MSTPPSATPIAAAPETLRADVIVVGGGLVGPGASKAAPSDPGIGDSMAELIATGLPSTPYPARHLGRLAAGQEQATA